MSATPQQLPPAGWYPDTEMVDTHRYWDGQAWTDHRQPVIPSPATEPKTSSAVGYWCAILLPIVGFIIGIAYLNKKPSDGVAVMVLSVLAFFFWSAALGSFGY